MQLNSPLYFDSLSLNRQHIENDITPRSFGLDVFTAEVNFADEKKINSFLHPGITTRILNKLNINKKVRYKENSLPINPLVFRLKPPVYFDGFWQSEQYFVNIDDKIREAFTFRSRLSSLSQKLSAKILQHENAVSVHIRRGDYISSERTKLIHGICPAVYYANAIDVLKKRLANPHFYVFSDEPQWVKQNLLDNFNNYTLVEHNTENESWQDMALMSKCKHHIIANSSFSWWGAWLNANKEKIVIAPKNWFNVKTDYFDTRDLLPATWIKLDYE